MEQVIKIACDADRRTINKEKWGLDELAKVMVIQTVEVDSSLKGNKQKEIKWL